MTFILISIAILLAGSLCAFIGRRFPAVSATCGVLSAMIASAFGLVPALRTLTTGTAEALSLPWSMLGAQLVLGLDPLSALFLVPLLILTALCALYGSGYLAGNRKRSVAFSWSYFNLLTASMIGVLVARGALCFLIAWEVMSLASLLLVVFDHQEPKVQQAGWTYFIATHIGTSLLLVMFLLMAQAWGDGVFAMQGLPPLSGPVTVIVFICAIIGFGCKAGFVPLHVWLPEAHPAAPSHVSAVMSGIMIKMGLYGILRVLTVIGPPPAWWGITLTAIGLLSGLFGVLYAVCQSDIKRLLAYSSVENIGIITMGIGLGLMGVSFHLPLLAVLGFAGAFLHIVNHAFFKGMLFLTAGAVLHATETRDMEKLGGLLKRMPMTGGAFLLGSIAICGLPPLNGFISEFMLYMASLTGISASPIVPALAGICVIIGLALIGGLAVATFTKAFGIAFLGEARSSEGQDAHECDWRMRLPMAVLGLGCVGLAFGFVFMIGFLSPVIASLTGLDVAAIDAATATARAMLNGVLLVSGILLAIGMVLWLIRSRLARGEMRASTVTWDCGYARPTARIQYTASSFAEPIVSFFTLLLRPRNTLHLSKEYFPAKGRFFTRVDDLFMARLYVPIFRWVENVLPRLHWLQSGRVNLYVLYIAVAAVTTILIVFFGK
jgi:formate hydrogenlyase subunit 3/multisubunit Na+/H+ antiporter MnhD subunit